MDLRYEKGIDLYEIDAFSNWFNFFYTRHTILSSRLIKKRINK